MTSKVKFSTFSIVLSLSIMAILILGCILTHRETVGFLTLFLIIIFLVAISLLYAPCSISADSEYVVMKSPLKRRMLKIEDIENIELCQPTMGAIRVCASGGFIGYWGIFKEGGIGRYYAFYGRGSDCFLIKMKNGDYFMLGCEDPKKIVTYIQSQVKK